MHFSFYLNFTCFKNVVFNLFFLMPLFHVVTVVSDLILYMLYLLSGFFTNFGKCIYLQTKLTKRLEIVLYYNTV